MDVKFIPQEQKLLNAFFKMFSTKLCFENYNGKK